MATGLPECHESVASGGPEAAHSCDDGAQLGRLSCRREIRARRATQNTWAVGMGHQRICTFPMMYFFGTKPQCRLSELLFRWSPMTK